MSITYTWEFPRFNTFANHNGLEDVVYNIEYILSATDGEGHGSQIFGTVGVSDPDPLTFKPFRLLTQRVVEQWVESALGEEVLTDMKNNLANQINNQKNPSEKILNKPW